MNLLDRLAQVLKQAPPPPLGPPSPQVTNQTRPGAFLNKPRVIGIMCACGALLWVFAGSTPKRAEQPVGPGLHNTDPAAAASMFTRELGRAPDASALERARAESELARRNAAYQVPTQPAYPAGYPYGGQPVPSQQYGNVGPMPAEDPVKADRRKREYASLFANPVIPVGSDSLPVQETRMRLVEEAQPIPALAATPGADKPAAISKATPSHDCVDEREEGGAIVYAVCEGSFIEARLNNRLDGEAPGPVIAVITREVRSRDRLHVVIPAGTTLIGEASAVTGQYQRRLQVVFHRIIMPDGRGFNLAKAVGLDHLGAIGVHDKVDRHLPSLILATIATGGLSALAQAGTGNAFNGSSLDAVRSSMGQSAAQVGQQQFSRTTGRLPTITIREGQIVNLFLATDLHLKEWK